MISFVIPAYNEESLLGRTLDAVNDAARASGQPFEVIVADVASGGAAVTCREIIERGGVDVRHAVAVALHIPLGTVKSRLHNGLAALRGDPRMREYFEP